MSGPIINGTLMPVSKSRKFRFDPTKGAEFEQQWESAGDNLGGLANNYLAQRVRYEWDRNARKSSLTATSTIANNGLPEVIIDTWQVLANEIQFSIWENPKCRFALSSNVLIALVKAANENKSVASALADAAAAGAVDAELASSNSYYRLFMSGTTHYASTQYVLKHTTNVGNQYDGNRSDVGVETIYTTSELLDEVTSPFLWVFPMPGRLQAKLNSITSPFVPSGYIWGWRKLASNETTAANNRIDISSEYWLGAWTTLLYDAF